MTLNITDIELYSLLKAKIRAKEDISKDFGTLHDFLNVKFKDIDDRIKDLPTKDFVQKEISNSKAEMMKAIYVTSFIQILSIIGGILAISKFFK